MKINFSFYFFNNTNKKKIFWFSFLLLTFNINLYSTFAQSTENEDYTVAVNAFTDGLFDLSYQQFELFIKQYPKSKRKRLAQFFLGEIAYQQKNYKDALRKFKLFTKGKSNTNKVEKALFRMGQCNYNLKKYNQAVNVYLSIWKRFPHSKSIGDAFYWMGENLFAQKKFAEASKAFQKAVFHRQSNSYFIYSLFKSALCLYKLNDFPDASKQLKAVLNEKPSNDLKSEAIYYLLKSYFKSKKNKEFIDFALSHKDELSSERNQVIIIEIGTVYLRLNSPQKLISFYESLIDSKQENKKIKSILPQIFYLLGISNLELKKYEKGIDYFTRVSIEYSKTPQAEKSIINLGYIYLKMSQFDEAEEFYNKYLKEYPSGRLRLKAFLGLASLYEQKNNYDEAIKYLQKALKIAEKSEKQNIYLTIANLFKKEKKFDKAIEEFSKIAQNPVSNQANREQSFFQIGVCYYLQGNYLKAITNFQQFIIQFPVSPLSNKSKYWLGEASLMRKDYNSSVVAFEEYLKDTTALDLQLKLKEKIAYAYFKQKEWKKSLEYYEQISDKLLQNDTNKSVLLNMLQCLLQLNRRERAIIICHQIINQFPKSSFLASIQLILSELLVSNKKPEDALAETEKILFSSLSSSQIWRFHLIRINAFQIDKRYHQAENEIKILSKIQGKNTNQKCSLLLLYAKNYFLENKTIYKGYNYLIQIIKLKPKDEIAEQAFKLFCEESKRTHDEDSYITFLELVSSVGSKNLAIKAVYFKGLYYFKTEEFKQSIQNFENYIELVDNNQNSNEFFVPALMHLALLYERKQDFNIAKKYYERVIQLGKPISFVNAALERLQKFSQKRE